MEGLETVLVQHKLPGNPKGVRLPGIVKNTKDQSFGVISSICIHSSNTNTDYTLKIDSESQA